MPAQNFNIVTTWEGDEAFKTAKTFYFLTYLKGFQISVASSEDKASGLEACLFTKESDIR